MGILVVCYTHTKMCPFSCTDKCVLVMALVLAASLSGERHLVGNSIWSIPPHSNFYSQWSSNSTFHTGDSLYFNFDNSGMYNVIEVWRGDFDQCSAEQPVEAFMEGPLVFPLPRQGVFYFICNISNYCALGQKFTIVVELLNIDSPSLSISPFLDTP